ncbi:MAG: CinA family protein [Thermodesulfovibrionales bacterium]|nr:CinA family protein [Thermodesulfovibrionales bacterium]
MTNYSLEVHNLLVNKKKTLSIAESCTGGLISHLLTEHSGASAYLITSVVAYSVMAKNKLLNIDSNLIKKYGTISPEIATYMAKNVKEITGSDYSLATTGNLGPRAIEDKELGLLYIAFCSNQGIKIQRFQLKGNRKSNKEEAALLALKTLYEQLLQIT